MTSGIRLQGKIAPYVVLLRAIAHPYRLSIVYVLAQESLRTRDLIQRIGIPQSLMVHHLNAMEKTGWIKKFRDGRHMRYILQKKGFKDISRLLSETPFWRALVQ